MNACRICNKKAHEHLWYCEEHYKCEDCGTRDGIITRTGELTCYKCHMKRMEKKISSFDEDTDFTDEVICPWCGYEYSDSWELSESGEIICNDCEREFEFCRDVVFTYSSSRKTLRK